MAWFRCIGDNGGGGGGGSFTPTFSKILIADNTSLATDTTFTDDYTKYDFLEVELYNTSSLVTTTILTTPEIVDDIFTYSQGRLTFGEFGNNQYCSHSKPSSDVWRRTNGRNLYIKNVYGVNCTNATVSKTWIYQRQGISNVSVSISSTGLLSYDIILLSGCTGTYDETQPNACYIAPKTTGYTYPIGIAVMTYNTAQGAVLTDTYMSAALYMNVQGIKFIS